MARATRETSLAPAQPVQGGATDQGMMQMGLTKEEIVELQKVLSLGPGMEQEDEVELDGNSDLTEDLQDTRERVYLVGVELKSQSGSSKKGAKYNIHDSLEELARLANTANLKVMGSSYQVLATPNNATYVGSGKVAEIIQAVRAYGVDTVIFDDELSPGQLRNLEKVLGCGNGSVRVCDRTALILDIFMQRAQTKEGKLQVELAQTEYQLPRLTRMWTHLDRVGGGGAVKGTGEKQIETDKRLLRDRISALRKELESVRTHRRNYRKRRQAAPIPVVALIGYTNAGKSTLLNQLSNAEVLAEDKLFATLDPTTRNIRLKGNQEVLISDTVGFIQKLPTQLVAAFRATLEEITDASVLLHLVDISHPNAAAQCDAVLQVLDELDMGSIPVVTAWNKADACPDPDQVRKVAARRRDTVCISGLTGEGLEPLMDLISAKLAQSMVEVEVYLPYSAGDVLDEIHTRGNMLEDPEYTATGVKVQAMVPPHLAGRLRQFSLQSLEDEEEVEEEDVVWSKLSNSSSSRHSWGDECSEDDDQPLLNEWGGLVDGGNGNGRAPQKKQGKAVAASSR
eukprot:CAMPEP_0202349620 /NCGR_PEP_ID=MMETSP1126-20121109/7035_1 /ASSEMBLY_ACC=CAM_ASM_000457 /TAXON_ID=3047 /ORGANISM="Dunaliella tertiolecta, Strain CCMP1320" /LENGTH=567 /DNA_ID=CAMNT_0048941459 /DNA_START=1727 /DNA_END=3430 /DNA_ORIENTATION=-